MKRFMSPVVLVVLLFAVMIPAAANETITVQHDLGEVVIPKNPQRVIVFDFGALDTMMALGAEPVGLPKGGTIPSYLSKFRDGQYANVGTLTQPNLEQVYALKPDLIIISARQSSYYEEFSAIAPTLYLTLDQANYMESFAANARLLGQIFGRVDAVENALAGIRASVEALRSKVEQRKQTALVVLVNDKSVSAYGPRSRFGLIHDEFGFFPARENIVASTHGQTISFEFILASNPDYLFVIDRTAAVDGKPAAKETIENQLVRYTKAYQNGNIVYLDPEYWYLSGGGLLSVAAMVDEIAAAVK